MASLWSGRAASMFSRFSCQASSTESTTESSTLQSEYSASHLDKYHLENSKSLNFGFESDLYTNAFIACLESKVKPMPRACCDACAPVMLMCVVAIVQALATIGVNQYVSHELMGSKTRGMTLGVEFFFGTGAYLPIETASRLCGGYEQMEISGTNGTQHDIFMADGTVYAPSDDDDDMPMFYNLKLPSLTWNPKFWSKDRSLFDDAIFVSYEGMTFDPFKGNLFSLLFITLLALWLCTIVFEFRNIFHLAGALNGHFWSDSTASHYLEEDPESRKFKIVGQLRGIPLCVGVSIVLYRALIAPLILYVGSRLEMYSTNKLDLVLNGLALTFILELDSLVFHAIVPPSRQQFIADIEEMSYFPWHMRIIPPHVIHYWQVLLPLLKFFTAVAFGVYLRYLQLAFFEDYASQMAALCLLAGPPPLIPGANQAVVAPVVGFCESLLGVTCAPNIRKCDNCSDAVHGPCVVTDQTVFRIGNFSQYLNNGAGEDGLFDGIFVNGTRQSWVEWGPPHASVDTALHWNEQAGTIHDDLRKACLQMYDPSGTIDSREVDPDTGEVMNGSPFYCASDIIGGLMGKGFKHPDFIKALDTCAEDNLRRANEKNEAVSRRRRRRREQLSKTVLASMDVTTSICKTSCSKGTMNWSAKCKLVECVHCAACQPPQLAPQQPIFPNSTDLVSLNGNPNDGHMLTSAISTRQVKKLRHRIGHRGHSGVHSATGGELHRALYLARADSRTSIGY